MLPLAVDRQKPDIGNVYQPPSDHYIFWIDTEDFKIGAWRTFPTQHWNNYATMVKFTTATLQAMVGANPTGPINKIHDRLTFSTLWNLQRQIVDRLCRVGNVKFSLDGNAR